MRRYLWLSLALTLSLILILPAHAEPGSAPVLDDTYGFLSFWNSHEGERLFGPPITEVREEGELIVQYFERARFEYHAGQSAPVLLGLLGVERTRWRTFPAQPPVGGDVLRFESTSYVLGGVFRQFWEKYGGVEIFGLPISPPLWESTANGRLQVQYFERTLLIHHPLRAGTSAEIELAALGRDIAASKGLIEGSALLPGSPMYAFDPAPPPPPPTAVPTPAPTAVAAAKNPPAAEPAAQQVPRHVAVASKPASPSQAPSQPAPSPAKQIIVDLSQQWLYAYEGDSVVFDAPVATGKDGFNTPAGSFQIYAKTPLQTMRGSINGESWWVPNVPHAMYFTGSVALHGTYWHNLFGSGVRISHGCVNLPLDAAAWLYDWARVGTPVNVRY